MSAPDRSPQVERGLTLEGEMLPNRRYTLTCLIATMAFASAALLLTGRSWSSLAPLFLSTPPPQTLPAGAATVSLTGGFPSDTSLWLAPEPSIRSAVTSTLATCGLPQHFVVRGDRIYVANGPSGFLTITGQSSVTPRVSGALVTEGQGVAVALLRNVALLAAGSGGLQIIDIRDDQAPRLLARLPEVAPAIGIAQSGNIAYIASGKKGLHVVDLADPRHPRVLARIADLGPIHKVASDGELLVAALARNEGLAIFEISNPGRPRRLAVLPLPGRAVLALALREQTALVATTSKSANLLQSVDLAHPAQPRVASSLPLDGFPLGMAWTDERATVALGTNGMRSFELDAAQRLHPAEAIGAKVNTRFAVPQGDVLWVADGRGELLRIDPGPAVALTPRTILPALRPGTKPVVTSQLILSDDATGLVIYARGEQNAPPTLLSRLPVAGQIAHLLLVDQLLFLGIVADRTDNAGKLLIVDISSPAAPRIAAELPLAQTPLPVGVFDKTLVLGESLYLSTATTPPWWSKPSRLLFIDISSPENPSIHSIYPLETGVSGIALSGGQLALMQSDGRFQIIDATTAATPEVVATLQMPWLHAAAWHGVVSIVVKNRVAFVSSSLSGIEVIDLREPDQPRHLGRIDTPAPTVSMTLEGNLLFADILKQGLLVVDLKQPLEPQTLGLIPLPGMTRHLLAQGGRLWYVIRQAHGLWSMPLPQRLRSTIAESGSVITGSAPGAEDGPWRFWLVNEDERIDGAGVTWIGDVLQGGDSGQKR